MVWIDLVCCVIIAILTLLGLWRGFLKSIFSLCAWISGLVGAFFATDLLGDFFTNLLDIKPFTVKILCVCIGFLIPFLLFTFIGHILNDAVKKSVVSGINRILGAALGMIKASIVCFLFLTVIHLIPASSELKEARNNAIAYSAYKQSLEAMGFSSEEINLIDIAEKKVSEAANSAVENSKEAVKEATLKAIKNSFNDKTKDTVETIDSPSKSTQKQ